MNGRCPASDVRVAVLAHSYSHLASRRPYLAGISAALAVPEHAKGHTGFMHFAGAASPLLSKHARRERQVLGHRDLVGGRSKCCIVLDLRVGDLGHVRQQQENQQKAKTQ